MVFSINCLYFRLFVAPVYSLTFVCCSCLFAYGKKRFTYEKSFFFPFFLSPKCVFPYKFARPEVSDPVRPVER